MLADVLDAPVAKLTMCNNINAAENLVDTWTLFQSTLVSFLRSRHLVVYCIER